MESKELIENDDNLVQGVLFNSESEDDVEVDYLNKITDTVLWSTDWTVESIISAQKRSTFNINPGFQRRDAWNSKKKSRFIESLIYGLPVPQIVLAEDIKNRGRYLVVDGKQRLITIFSFFSNEPGIGFELTGLNSNTLNGCSVGKLESQYPDLYNNLLNQAIRSIIIKNWTSENLLYTIFYRLNSGSLPLSPQELRKALKPGKFLDYIDEYCSSSQSISKLFKTNTPDPRMRDMDLVLRYFVMTKHTSEYRGNYKLALDTVSDYYNKNWDKLKTQIDDTLKGFESIIELAYLVFGEDQVFRRPDLQRADNRVNRALFDIICYYFNQQPRDEILSKKDQLISLLFELCDKNPVFLKAISSNTNNLKETSARFVIFGESFQALIGKDVNIPSNLKAYYSKNK
ncbi:MAG TPA: DUF262 domain-containing protein [Bacilli bacterium]|nr:DUF262 domain-containing protein [Candidatus Cloacimonas sp.]HQP14306.1 DUF262 domain-containing protein [Bacilli bacterium]